MSFDNNPAAFDISSGHAFTTTLLNPFALLTPFQQYSFWQVEYYQQFFNVDTMDVRLPLPPPFLYPFPHT